MQRRPVTYLRLNKRTEAFVSHHENSAWHAVVAPPPDSSPSQPSTTISVLIMVRSRVIAFCVAVLASTASAFAPTRAAASASPAARSTGLHSLRRSVDELRYNAMMNFVGVLFNGGGDSTGGVLPNAAPPSRRRAAAAAVSYTHLTLPTKA